jgi:hypothetical protein
VDNKKGHTQAFWDGCRIALLGHLITWLVVRSAEQVWHLAGHVATGIALYIVESLILHS